MSQIENTSDLRRTLADTIAQVRLGVIGCREAQAVAALSGKILQSARLDLDVMRFASLNGGDATTPSVPLIPAKVSGSKGKKGNKNEAEV